MWLGWGVKLVGFGGGGVFGLDVVGVYDVFGGRFYGNEVVASGRMRFVVVEQLLFYFLHLFFMCWLGLK